jgi:DNA/RNA endonuclease G (NUC1)/V8-like Glu-specific endopeptidase
MERQKKAELLKRMLFQIAPGDNVESLAKPARAEGLESVDQGSTPAETGLRKVAEGRDQDLTDEEITGLEAIVLPKNRPVVFVRGDSYDSVDDPWQKLNPPDVKAKIARWFPSIGRIEVPNVPQIPYGGTGFVVGKGLVMTNRHVAKLFSSGLGLKIAYNPGDSVINFRRQVDTGSDQTVYAEVLNVEMIHPYWDMALLRVADLPDDSALSLSTKMPEDLEGRDIVAVGYPAKDWRSDLALQDRIFNGQYNVKRLQPGVLRKRARIRSFENLVNAVTHDASTLGGNSGSAILDVETKQVLALHFGGEYLKANYAVPMYELARDSRVTAMKLNFDNTLTSTNDWEPSWRLTEDTEATVSSGRSQPGPSAPLQSPAPAQTATVSRAQTPAANVPMSTGSATWTIPIHVTVSIGTAQQALQQAATARIEAETAEEGVVIDQDYSTRPGYDPNFLDGVTVPLPKLTSKSMEEDTAQVATDARKHNDPFELAYYHYSVYMNKKRRTAWFSAANVDGDHRPDIGTRSGDRWYRDTRIQMTEQLGQGAFESGIDRGHLTRREDTAWGKDAATAMRANNDTFHFTNCSLQASHFNRGKDRWQGIEQYLLEKHAKKDKRRMTVITGPLFAANDPVYRNDKMDYSVRCPLQYWKVCVLVRNDGSVSATAFLLNQSEIQDLPGFEETFDVAATQVKISDLETKTKLDFGDLKEHDHFAQGSAPGTLEAPTGLEGETQTVKLIFHPSDIVV